MSENSGWLRRQRTGLWHLRKRGIKGYAEWKNRATTPLNPPVSAKPHDVKPSPVTISDVSVPVIAGLATMPSRMTVLREAFHSIYWQVDEVHVFLNNFEEVPEFLEVPRVTIYRSQDYKDYKDVGKFFALEQLDEGILFTIDDDILYPPDYVSRMLSYLASVDFRAAIGVHGFQLPRYPKSFFDRQTFHFRRRLDNVTFASVLGTGTVVFDIANVGLAVEDFQTFGMADIYFAAYLKRKAIPALLVPREAEWLRPLANEEELEDTNLYFQTQQNAAPHSKILRSSSPWGEEDTLARWGAMSDDSILSDNLVNALSTIRDFRSESKSNVHDILAALTSQDFTQRLRWIELYADVSTREILLKSLLECNLAVATELKVIKSLWPLDAGLSIKASQRVVDKRHSDAAVLRQHANLCERYFLDDDAEEYYLRAVRIAGAKGLRSTTTILYEYFRYLVRYRHFEKALVLESSLKASQSNNPSFKALIIQASLGVGAFDTANDWLVELFDSASSTRKDRAINALITELTEGPTPYGSFSPRLAIPSILGASDQSPEHLTALLKIATLVKDREGAFEVWKTLSKQFPQYMAMYPEVSKYFATNWSTDGAVEAQDFIGHRAILAQSPTKEPYDHGPLVSVILTAYNSAATLPFAIESILKQSHQNLELLIVDDDSQDNSVAVAQEWVDKDARVRLYKNARNKGPYISRNIALTEASGEFIAIQDADDVSVPDRLFWQLEEFSPDIKAVLGQHIRVNKEGAVQLENDGSILGHGPVTLMVRRETVEEVGPFARVRTRGDKEFESRLEHFYGSTALLRTNKLLVFALEDDKSNSRIETASLEKKRDLMLFKRSYTRAHAAGQF